MLARLTVADFALVDRLTVELDPGLNVFTGDTGAGKSIVVNAMALLGGRRAETRWVRSGAAAAYIEGVFELPVEHPAWRQLAANGIEMDDGQLIVGREISRAGRSLIRLNGRAVPLKLLETIGPNLVEINGQHQQQALFHRSAQREHLDAFGDNGSLLKDYHQLFAEYRANKAELDQFGASERARRREIDLLTFQVDEIAAADLTEGDDSATLALLTRHSNFEQLADSADQVRRQLSGPGSASDQLGQAIEDLVRLRRLEPAFGDVAEQLRAAQEIADQSAAAVSSQLAEIPTDQASAELLAQRVRQIDDLKRKYGDSITEVLAFADSAAGRLRELLGADERIGQLTGAIASRRAQLGDLGGRISDRRRQAAKRLSSAVEANLAQLGMDQARLPVSVDQSADPDGLVLGDGARPVAFDRYGADAVRFDLAANPGEPLRPLAEIASGGETSRIMLALRCALASGREGAAMVFDEIDAGIGARRGAAVGRQLWQLAGRAQVICVTHLPQIPAFAHSHQLVAKHLDAGRTVVNVHRLDRESQRAELAAMVGSLKADDSVAEILQLANQLPGDGARPPMAIANK